MNKSKFEHVTDELLGSVKEVITESLKHTYSTSKVYRVHNRVFDMAEHPTTCGTCLKMRVLALKRWLAEYEEHLKNEKECNLSEQSLSSDSVQKEASLKIAQKVKKTTKKASL